MKKKAILALLLSFVLALGTPHLETFAHAHEFVLYERQLQDVRTRDCKESVLCTVTTYYYSNRYKCRYCDYGYTINTEESFHSYNHNVNP